MRARVLLWTVAAILAFLTLAPGAFARDGSGADWGARDPTACVPLRQEQQPTPEQAIQLVKCRHETASASSGELWLMENVKLEVGAMVPFVVMYDRVVMADADTAKPTYPLRGSFTWAVCMSMHDAGIGGGDARLNCRETDVAGATGACWQTTFGDWSCVLHGYTSGETRRPTRAPQ
jgi:hypothetical protein